MVRRLVLAMVIALLAGAPPAQAVVIDRIVATVDGEPITLFELERYIRMNGAVDPSGASDEDRERALDALIGETLVRLESRRLGLMVSREDVDLYIEEIKRGNNLDDASLAEALAQQGFTVETYKNQIARDLLKNQLIMRQLRDSVQVSPVDVRRYYDENKTQFAKSGEVHLLQIFFPLAPTASPAEQEQVATAVQAATIELQAGKPFAEVARKYSRGPEASDGGALGWMKKGQMMPDLEQVAFSLPVGRSSPPVRTGAGIHILMVDEMKASEFVPFETVEPQLTEMLFNKEVEEQFNNYVESDLTEGHAVERRLKPATISRAPATDEATSGNGGRGQTSGSGDHSGCCLLYTSPSPRD